MGSLHEDDASENSVQSNGSSDTMCGHKALLLQMGCKCKSNDERSTSEEDETGKLEQCSSDSSASDKGGGIWHWLCHPSTGEKNLVHDENDIIDCKNDNVFASEVDTAVYDCRSNCICSCCPRKLVNLDACNDVGEESSISTSLGRSDHESGKLGYQDCCNQKVLVEL